MKLHLPKQLFSALLAVFTMAAAVAATLGSTAWGDGVLTDFSSVSTGKSSPAVIELGDDKLTVTTSSGLIWRAESFETSDWMNVDALYDFNVSLGKNKSESDINSYYPVVSGHSDSSLTLTLDLSSYDIGDTVILYALGAADKGDGVLTSFTVSGLDNVSIGYATETGVGFDSNAAYTSGAGKYTLFKVTGKVKASADDSGTPDSIVLTARGNNKNAWGMLAYNAAPMYWEGGSGEWKAEAWSYTDGATEGKGAYNSASAAYFTGATEKETITISSAITALGISVSKGSYVFTKDENAADASLTTKNLLVKDGGQLTLDFALGIAEGTVTVAGSNSILNLAGGTAEAPVTHSIGTLEMNAASTLQGSSYSTVSVKNINFAGSSVCFDGVNLTETVGGTATKAMQGKTIDLKNGAVVNSNSYFGITNGTLDIKSSVGGGILYIDGLRLSDGNGEGTLNVNENAHLIIKGTASGQEGSLALSHWNQSNTLNVYGILTSNAVISSWYGGKDNKNPPSLNVKDGGQLNLLKGIDRNTERGNNINLKAESGASIYAAGGKHQGSLKLTLEAGSTLGGISNNATPVVTFTNNMTLGTADIAGTVTIDTDVRSYDTTTLLLSEEGTAGTIVLNGTLTFAETTTLDVTGNGTLSVGKALNLASGVVQLNGNKLILGNGTDQATHSIGTVKTTADSIIRLSANSTLNRVAAVSGEGTLTLTGSGVYDMGASLESNVSGLDNSETWQGVVSLNGATFDETDLNSYGNKNSTIKICNGSGQLKEGVVNAQINFDGDAETVAYKLIETTGKTITFAGSVCGVGNLVVESNSATENIDTFIFTGDVSQWKGNFNGSKGGKLIYSGAANVIQNEILSGGSGGSLDVTFKNSSGMVVNGNINAYYWSQGTVNLNIENEEGATGEVVIKGSISAHNNSGNTNLTVGAGAKARLTHATSIKLNEVTLKDDATLTVTTSATVKSLSNVVNDQAKASITGKDSGAATLSAVQMSSEGISGISSGSSMSNALLKIQEGTTFSIADMTLTNVNINAESAQVTFNNVTFSNAAVVGTAVMEQTATMSYTNVSGNSFTASTTLLNGLTLESGATLTVDLGDLASLEPMGPGKYNLSITLSGFSMREGSSMLFAADSWLGQLLQEQNAGAYVAGSQALNQLSSLNAVGSTDTPTVSFTAQENVGTLVTITGLSIPEPTTATLSLLALAGLAARRRRK